MPNLPIPDETTWIKYDAQSSAGPFSFTFSIFAKADLRVKVGDVELTQSDFTFSGTLIDTGYDGGSITLNTAAVNQDVLIWRDVAPARTSDFAPASSIPVVNLDAAFDRLTANVQDLRRDVDRSIKVSLDADMPAETNYADLVADVADDVTAETVALVEAAGAAQIALVEAEGTTQVAAVEAAVGGAVAEVEAAGTTQAGLVETEGTTQVAAVNDAGNTKIAEIQATAMPDLYEDNTAFIAATVDGQVGGVAPASAGGDVAYTVTRNDAEVATALSEVPSKAYLDNLATEIASSVGLRSVLSDLIQEQVVGNSGAPVTGTNTGNFTFCYAETVTRDGLLASVRFFALATGTVRIRRFERSGTTNTQVGSDLTITVTATGDQTWTAAQYGDFPVLAGELLGFHGSGVIPYTVETGDAFYASGTGNLTSFTDASSATNNKLQISFTVESVVDTSDAASAATEVVVQRLGRQSTPSDGANPVNKTLVIAEALTEDLDISRIRLWSEKIGAVRYGVWSKSGDDFTEVESAWFWTTGAGLHELSVAEGHIPRIRGTAGQYVGYYSNAVVSVTATTANSGGWYEATGDVSSFTDTAAATNARLEISFDLTKATTTEDKVAPLLDRVYELENPNSRAVAPKHWIVCPVIGAQSNAQGRGDLNSFSPAAGTALMWNTSGTGSWKDLPDGSGGAWQNMADPTGNDSSNGGSAWCEAARRIYELTDGQVGLALINLGVGSTSLTNQWSSSGSLRALSLLHIAAAEAAMDTAGYSWQRGPILSIIGEADADNITAGSKTITDVETALQDFLTWARTNLGATTKMVMAVIGTKTSEGSGWTTMRNAQRHWGTKYEGVIVAHTAAKDFSSRSLMGVDGIHWKTAALEEVGRDFGTAIVNRCLGGG